MRHLIALVLTFSFFTNLPAPARVVKAKSSRFSLTRSIGLKDLLEQSGLVFLGKYAGYQMVEKNGVNARELKFRLLDPILGVENPDKKEVTVYEWAAINSPFIKEVEAGKSYVFFFYQPSDKGLTSLVGGEQGLVEVDDKEGLKYAARLVQTDELKERTQKQSFFARIFNSDKSKINSKKIRKYQQLKKLTAKNI